MKNSILRNVRCLSITPSKPLLVCNSNFHFATRDRQSRRAFRSSSFRPAIKPYLLADIGEGITECQIMSWSVQPGDRVEQFDKICEVQSDKASVEITSRFDGVVTALHYATDDMAIVGQPLIDIDIEDDISEVQNLQTVLAAPSSNREPVDKAGEKIKDDSQLTAEPQEPQRHELFDRALQDTKIPTPPSQLSSHKHASLLTPGVRHMLRKLNLNVDNIQGSGRDGRVLKEDIQRYTSKTSPELTTAASKAKPQASTEDRIHRLSPIERHMFKIMTSSLSIPHFLYTHNVDVTVLNGLRKKYNASKAAVSGTTDLPAKLTLLPFILKATSQSFMKYTHLNSHLDTETNPQAPQLLIKGLHNFGIAIDTPDGLLVPVVRDVQNYSIVSLASEISRLGKLAVEGRLAADDFKGATFTISNIGSIGGNVVSPVIVAPTTGILGIGRTQNVPVFDKNDQIVKREQITLSWSADHRILDGATVAKCAETVGDLLSNADIMGIYLR